MTFWVAGAIVVGAVVGGVAANNAASTQANAQTNAANMQQGNFNTIQGNLAPYMQAGQGALSGLQQFMGTGGNPNAPGYGAGTKSFTPQDFLNNQDPGYQFQLQQGAAATRNADTPGVGSLSGAALKDLTSFNQGMAATGYQNAFNRFQTQNNAIYGRLSSMANLGENAAAGAGAVGAPYAQGAAGYTAAAGASQAAGIVGGANAIGGAAVPLSYLLSNQPQGTNGGYGGAGATYTSSNSYGLGGATPDTGVGYTVAVPGT